MSNLFEEFSENDPQYIDLGEIETDGQRRLRECFESLQTRNEHEVACFDPNTPEAFSVIKCKTPEKEIEAAEPQLTTLLAIQMLRAAHLEIPKDDDGYDLIRDYTNEKRVIIFSVTRSDATSVPVYIELNKYGGPDFVVLMSYMKREESLVHYRDLDEYRSRLVKKLGIGEKILRTFSVEDLKDFDTSFDRIQLL